jgi:hypothetical protein
VDWNGDGKKDLLCGDASGKVVVFINVGTAQEPKLAAGIPVLSDGKPIVGVATKYKRNKDGSFEQVPNTTDVMGIYSKIHFADWNGDGLKDLLVGHEAPGEIASDIVVYLNEGTPQEPKLGKPQEIRVGAGARPSPYLVDLDGDGKVDLLCGTESNKVFFFRNTGTNAQPSYAKGVELDLGIPPKSYRCRIDVTDWDNDGKLDLLVGDFDSSDEKNLTGHVWLHLGK